ncbi:glycosyltransferase family 2 protein [Nguyenibacter vanlangensis]|uniref:Glycosyltransferase family 2 protein n=1 Tax=Nguyenibacter vanlangensis TaxID=1216886 RepID=A0A7Y7IVH6_9PROT|nr:glycosyltransferase family 2 protein [Nguyenibacter vanlangensis]NVN10590.1 glycosyltransferase family 2 protein [Nguyenibacter vanlangensis]
MSSGIYSVLVTYNPDLSRLRQVVAALVPQVGRVVIVDNGSRGAAEIGALASEHGLRFLPLPENRGIAFAQNAGIAQAEADEAQFVLLMDQDTVLQDGAIANLIALYRSLEADGVRVGSVGNAYRDGHDQKLNTIWRAEGRRLARRLPEPGRESHAEVDTLIASGSLIPLSVLREVGAMDAALFIDLVDLEWCFRATAHGYRHFMSLRNIMDHTIGSGRLNLGFRTVTLHAPIRNYYLVRNSAVLAARDYIKPAWRRFFARQLFFYILIYGTVADRNLTRLRLMLRGLWDGVRKRGGACPISA